MLKNALIAKTNGKGSPGNVVMGDGYRITVITPRLFRVEVAKKNIFEDMPTQSIWYRDNGPVEFELREDEAELIIVTEKLEFIFDKAAKKVEKIKFWDTEKTVKCSNKNNLKGTRRTLDLTFGPVKLGNGLISKNGVAIYDDSKSLLIAENGEIAARINKEKDLYIFAYGRQYRQCVRDFYLISGLVPLVPRWALGVWWSRYRAYTQLEYTQLMQRFEDEEIPLTVATVDMDWHWTDLNARFGTKYKKKLMTDNPCTGGWTGFSWNSELFPDYKAFLDWLHAKNLKITLNLHPADGIRFFEDMYRETALKNGVDPDSKQPVNFSAGKPVFWNSYFDDVLKPYEHDGVDFWWIDWQQGKKSDVPGLDPLWALNHYHFLDNGEDGRLPLILSRYAGAGSHRYPLGFSGDTAINWRVFKFQPYFTANAANIGYTWWSHDIGGHHHGKRDDELYIRWLQFGVFSTIMRLHSTSNDLLGKEPWRYPAETAEIAKNQLVLRHKLIPYLYTLDYRTHSKGLALCEPVYYSYPNNEDAYKIKNEYMFGSRLLVIPITSKADKKLKTASVRAWIPPGRWTDVFTGEIYNGERFITLYRDLTSIPVLAKQGSVIPLSADTGNGVANPSNLLLWVFRGDGKFELYEDSGAGDYKKRHAVTKFEVSEDEMIKLSINPPRGDLGFLPRSRNYKVVFKDIVRVKKVKVFINETLSDDFVFEGENISDKPFEIELKNVSAGANIRIEIVEYKAAENPPVNEKIVTVFSRWQASNFRKSRHYSGVRFETDLNKCRAKIKRMILPLRVKKALLDCFEE
jgi:hypothetical protein